jgi:hypothetical protein
MRVAAELDLADPHLRSSRGNDLEEILHHFRTLPFFVWELFVSSKCISLAHLMA